MCHEIVHIGPVLHLRHEGFDGRVGHFKGREQRLQRLLVRGLRAAIPTSAAGRSLIDAVVILIVEVVFGERRNVLRIHQRRNRTHAGMMPIDSAALHRQLVARSERRCRIVAARAHAILPDADKELSKNNARPTSVNAAADGTFSKEFE